MLPELKARWKEFRNFPPGKRFETFHEQQRERDRGKPWMRALYLGGALVAFAIGIVLAFIPGPAVVFFALSGALLGAQSHKMALALDWTELKIRKLAASAAASWRRFRGRPPGRAPHGT